MQILWEDIKNLVKFANKESIQKVLQMCKTYVNIVTEDKYPEIREKRFFWIKERRIDQCTVEAADRQGSEVVAVLVIAQNLF